MGETVTEAELDESTVHDVLRNERRRAVIERLRRNGERLDLRTVSERIAAEESGESPPPRNHRQSVYVSLHQTHLPKLDRLGIVDYDRSSKRIRCDDGIDALVPYLDGPETGRRFTPTSYGLATGMGLFVVGGVTVAPWTGYREGLVTAILVLLVLLGFSVVQRSRMARSGR